MQQHQPIIDTAQSSSAAVNNVLKNTYMLLGATLFFSAIMATLAMVLHVGHGVSLFCSLAALAIIWFVVPRTANSEKGILAVFAFTGLLGFGLGPILNHYMATDAGSAIVAQALGGTAIIFFALSAYVTTTKKDFSFLGGFLMVGMIVVVLAIIANLFFSIPAVSLAISAAVIFIMSGFILFETSQIIHGGQNNYILATASLYLSIYNIFVSLLQILGALNDD